MKENILSYTTRIGKTTFIVNVKQSESAKKAFEYGVSRDMQTRDVRRFFSG